VQRHEQLVDEVVHPVAMKVQVEVEAFSQELPQYLTGRPVRVEVSVRRIPG
jgi:hypothetical protein